MYINKIIHTEKLQIHCLLFTLLASSATYLTQCVKVVVLGFFTPSDGLCKDLLHFSPNDPRLNLIDGDAIFVYEYLINSFCTVGSTVLDMTTDEMKGMFIIIP